MSSSKTREADVVVIGAGPAGYVCAIRLAQLGKKVTVIDKGSIGGVCLNVGCIPSKALIHAGTTFEKMSHAEEMGITTTGVKVDFKKLMTWKGTVVKKLTGGVAGLLKANGCEVIAAEAKFTGPRELELTEGKTKTRMTFKQCVVATGSRPTALPGFDIDQKDILDSTGALEQGSLPKTMLCIGGGYIGLELGTFYAKMGTQVTSVVEASPSLLGMVDSDLTRVVEKGLKKRKVEILLNTKVSGQKKAKGGVEVSMTDKAGKTITKTYEKVLVTIGRRPNFESLDLEKAGLRANSHGFLQVDERLQTSIPGIYAIGYIAGEPLLAHKGSKEGMVCAEAISGMPTIYDVASIPAVIFTDPEVATVGLSESEAKEKGKDITLGVFPFAANGRALSVNETEGFVKIIGDKKTGRLLGVNIVGPEASNLIAECSLALEMGAQVEDLALTVHAHPTLPEAIMEGAEVALGHPIHIYKKPAAASRPQQPSASA